jgi:diaminopimelate decarboxylase
MDVRDNRLFLGGCAAEALAEEFGTPLYVYEEALIRRQCRLLREGFAEAAPEIHYSVKANPSPAILRVVRSEGLGIDAVSPMEVRLCLELGFRPEQIIFTGNNTSEAELRYCLERGVPVNVGSLSELARYGRLDPGGRVAVRINPDVGDGHHPHVITGGPKSKFGIYHTELPALQARLAEHRLTLIGVHSHIGTGILRTQQMLGAMEITLGTAGRLPGLEFVDFGGGFGVPYRPGQQPLPLAALGREMSRRFRRFCADYGRPLRMKLEPGRFLVAQSGTLLTRVTTLHTTPAHTFVGTDTGFNHLARPILYGAYHAIVNASAVEGPPLSAVVAGNICESGDVFTRGPQGLEERALVRTAEGDLLALRDVGAYGFNLASQYNLRPRPAEVMVDEGRARLIRRRETYEDLVRGYLDAEQG